MSMTSKEIPAELRRAAESLNNGNAHGDLRNYQPLAGPSTSQQSFRSVQSNSYNGTGTSAQSSFVDFAKQPIPREVNADDQNASRPPRLHYTEEDLRPRTEDSAAVLAMLNGVNEFDSLEAIEEEVSARQSLPWQGRQDAIIPQDPAPAEAVHSPEATYTSSDYPYLFNLLSLPEDESIAAYLSELSYTDDVWGLPMAIKQDLDNIKTPSTDASAREKALRRLGMLKNHLIAKSQPSIPSRPERATAQSMSDSDWDWIWTKQVG